MASQTLAIVVDVMTDIFIWYLTCEAIIYWNLVLNDFWAHRLINKYKLEHITSI